MIKYLGSKRLLVGALAEIATSVGATTALDLFTGTTRVAQAFKGRGIEVTACDVASYSRVFSDCYIATDRDAVDVAGLGAAIEDLNARPGIDGYVTRTFCEASRYFQPKNGRRIDAIRQVVAEEYDDDPVLLTALLDAADRVDSTTGLQMAYLKQWSPRSHEDLRLRVPDLLPGPGHTQHGDVLELVGDLPRVDLAYLDPPYNQHRYFTNYHVWETLVRADEPEHYGIACKRVDARDQDTKSVFNGKRTMPGALEELIHATRADTVVVSLSDESWVSADEMKNWLVEAGHTVVAVLTFDAKRYVGAQIGIFNGTGAKVGEPKRLRNVEQIFVASSTADVQLAAKVALAV